LDVVYINVYIQLYTITGQTKSDEIEAREVIVGKLAISGK